MKWIVAHPDTQHSLHSARALKAAGQLQFLFTSISLQRPEWLGPVLQSIHPTSHARLSQHRAHLGLSAEDIRVFPAHFLAARLGSRVWGMSQATFGRRAGRLAIEEGAGVMAFNTNAVETFRLLRHAKLPGVLDQTIAHRRWSLRVGQAECDAFPEWRDQWDAPDWRIALEDEELELADAILCGSEFCANTLHQEGVPPSKLKVVHYGTDTQRFTPARDPRPAGFPVRLLFVGTLSLRKGPHYLLDAASRLRSLGIEVTLVGRSQLSADRLRSYSTFATHRTHTLHGQMPEVYRQHDIYVFPSLVEGSSLSIYEALAAGLPVITTPNSGSIVRDQVEGLIVPPGDIEALTAAIERLVVNRDERVAMGRAARARSESYGDWSHYQERLVKALGQVAGP